MKKTVFLFSIFLFLFSGSSIASASVFAEQIIGNTYTTSTQVNLADNVQACQKNLLSTRTNLTEFYLLLTFSSTSTGDLVPIIRNYPDNSSTTFKDIVPTAIYSTNNELVTTSTLTNFSLGTYIFKYSSFGTTTFNQADPPYSTVQYTPSSTFSSDIRLLADSTLCFSETVPYFKLADNIIDLLPTYSLVDLEFPQNNTVSTTIPDFSNWVVSADNLNASSTYYFRIRYSLVSSTAQAPSVYYTVRYDYSSITGATSVLAWTIPKTETLTPSIQDDSVIFNWIVNVDLFSCLNFSTNCYLGSSGNYSIYTSRNSVTPTSTYSNLAAPFDPDLIKFQSFVSSTYNCPPAEDWTDIGGGIAYGMCQTFQFLFQPQFPELRQGLANGFNSVRASFPFSIFYSVVNAISTSTSELPNSQSFTVPFPILDGYGNSLTFLTSSTAQNVIGSDAKNAYFTVIENSLWIATGIIMLFTLI